MSGLLTRMPLTWTPLRRREENITPEDRKAVFEAFDFDEKIMKMNGL